MRSKRIEIVKFKFFHFTIQRKMCAELSNSYDKGRMSWLLDFYLRKSTPILVSHHVRRWYNVFLCWGMRMNRDSYAAGAKILDPISFPFFCGGVHQAPSNKLSPASMQRSMVGGSPFRQVVFGEIYLPRTNARSQSEGPAA